MNNYTNLQLVESILEKSGSTHEQTRNENIQIFLNLLSTNGFTNEQKSELTRKFIDENHLFYRIGERDTDSVFTRAYSAMFLTYLLQEDMANPFLSADEAGDIIEKCVTFLSLEKDLRGEIEEKGWANAIYFGANLTAAIIHHPSYDAKLNFRILQGIKDCFWKNHVYINDEEEQLVGIVKQLITSEIEEAMLIEWVEQVFDKLQFYQFEVGNTPTYYAARTNILHFMKTLYFTLKFSNKMPELRGVTSIFIGKTMN